VAHDFGNTQQRVHGSTGRPRPSAGRWDCGRLARRPDHHASKDDYSLETYILGTDHYQIELLANLDKVPEAGAIVVVTFPKPKGGSGFPARVFAIVP